MGALNKWAHTFFFFLVPNNNNNVLERGKYKTKTKKSPKSTSTNYCVANGYSQIREACANNNKRIHDTTSINFSWLVLVFFQWGWKKKKEYILKNPFKRWLNAERTTFCCEELELCPKGLCKGWLHAPKHYFM